MAWRVEAPARLHLGFASTGEALPPWFGIGLSLERPRTVVEARRLGKGGVLLLGRVWDEAEEVVRTLCRELGVEGGVEIRVAESTPRHVGLGSSTQLYLSILTALSLVVGRRIDEAVLVRRGYVGAFSWVGVAAFKKGGFIVDLGVGHDARRSYLSLQFPEDWWIVLARPLDKHGHPRKGEADKIRSLRYGLERELRLSRLLFQKIVPGVLEKNLELFGEGLSQYQRTVGEVFNHLQGGIFNPDSAPIIEIMEQQGLLGTGQSSWGPTCYGFTESLARAEEVRRHLAESSACEAWITRANNNGARAAETAT